VDSIEKDQVRAFKSPGVYQSRSPYQTSRKKSFKPKTKAFEAG